MEDTVDTVKLQFAIPSLGLHDNIGEGRRPSNAELNLIRETAIH